MNCDFSGFSGIENNCFNIIAIEQSDKTLIVKKYKLDFDPGKKVFDIVDLIFQREITPVKSCSVTLTEQKKQPKTYILSFDTSSTKEGCQSSETEIERKTEKDLISQKTAMITVYSRNSSKDGSNADDGPELTLYQKDPKGGPFGIFDTPKKVDDWTWEKVDIKRHFPSSEKIALDTPLENLKTKELVLHFPILEAPSKQDESPNAVDKILEGF